MFNLLHFPLTLRVSREAFLKNTAEMKPRLQTSGTGSCLKFERVSESVLVYAAPSSPPSGFEGVGSRSGTGRASAHPLMSSRGVRYPDGGVYVALTSRCFFPFVVFRRGPRSVVLGESMIRLLIRRLVVKSCLRLKRLLATIDCDN